jgi:hypothetical protein
MAVRKRGRTTGLTYGTVDSVSLSVKVDYEDGIGEKILSNQIGITPDTAQNASFGTNGDSGSVVVDNNRKIVGLYFAGSDDGYGVANPIADVLTALNISICTPPVKSLIKDLKDGRKDFIKDRPEKWVVKDRKFEKAEIKEFKIEKNEKLEIEKDIAHDAGPAKSIAADIGPKLADVPKWSEGGFVPPDLTQPGGPLQPGAEEEKAADAGKVTDAAKVQDVLKPKEINKELSKETHKEIVKEIHKDRLPKEKLEKLEKPEKPEKDNKDSKDQKEGKDHKEQKDQKDHKPERKELKEHKSEHKEQKDQKDHKPEHKETKDQKPEQKELKDHKPEHKELKDQKPEQKEIKEYKIESKEGKSEFEKGIPEGNIPKSFEGGPELPTQPPGTTLPGGLEERIAQLEAAVGQLTAFISGELRPDLSGGALSQEPDIKGSGEC